MFCEQYVTVADLGRRFAFINPCDFLRFCCKHKVAKWGLDVFHCAKRSLALRRQLGALDWRHTLRVSGLCEFVLVMSYMFFPLCDETCKHKAFICPAEAVWQQPRYACFLTSVWDQSQFPVNHEVKGSTGVLCWWLGTLGNLRVLEVSRREQWAITTPIGLLIVCCGPHGCHVWSLTMACGTWLTFLTVCIASRPKRESGVSISTQVVSFLWYIYIWHICLQFLCTFGAWQSDSCWMKADSYMLLHVYNYV